MILLYILDHTFFTWKVFLHKIRFYMNDLVAADILLLTCCDQPKGENYEHVILFHAFIFPCKTQVSPMRFKDSTWWYPDFKSNLNKKWLQSIIVIRVLQGRRKLLKSGGPRLIHGWTTPLTNWARTCNSISHTQ